MYKIHNPVPKATRRVGIPSVRSHFQRTVWRDGKVIYRGPHERNLTTDSASGYTNRRDWQSKLMGGGVGAAPIASYAGAATASSATTLTNSGASFPTAGQGLSGCIVVACPNSSGTGSKVFGMIVSNTATVLTVDQWYDPTTFAAGTTPNATASYVVLPGQLPAMWLALTSDSGAASASDTSLASEATTNGLGRALATYAHTAAASTYTLQKVFNATGSLTVNKEANFASAVASTGPMPFESAVGSPPALINGDQMTLTDTITIN